MFYTCWHYDAFCYVMTSFLTYCVMFWRHDVFLKIISFNVMTYLPMSWFHFWHHYFLTLWLTCWRYDIPFDVMAYFMIAWYTFKFFMLWRTFWQHDVLFDIMTYCICIWRMFRCFTKISINTTLYGIIRVLLLSGQ